MGAEPPCSTARVDTLARREEISCSAACCLDSPCANHTLHGQHALSVAATLQWQCCAQVAAQTPLSRR